MLMLLQNYKMLQNVITIAYFERTFIQDFKNLGEKIHLLGARERYWRLD